MVAHKHKHVFCSAFQFETKRNVSEEDNTEDITQNVHQNEDSQRGEEARVGQNRWCLGNNCSSMPTERESVCCKELRFLSAAVQGKHVDQTITV